MNNRAETKQGKDKRGSGPIGVLKPAAFTPMDRMLRFFGRTATSKVPLIEVARTGRQATD